MIGRKVIVNWGRNAGEVGEVTLEENGLVFIDFGREILVDEGFGSEAWYHDGYWSKLSGIQLLDEVE